MTLGANMSIGGLVVNDTTPVALIADGNALTIGSGGITVNNSSGNPTVTLGSLITLGATQTWTNKSSNALTVSGVVSDGGNAFGITTVGPGNVTLLAANTYTGNTTVNSGSTLQLGNQTVTTTTPLSSTGTIAVNGTLLVEPSTSGMTIANTITGTGNITLSGSTTSAPAALTISGTVTGFTGTWTLNTGRLQTALASIGAATDVVTINGNSTVGGELFSSAAVTIANPITINGIGATRIGGKPRRHPSCRRHVVRPDYAGKQRGISAYNSTGTISGLISDGGGGYVLTYGTQNTGVAGGTITVSHASNTYSGGTIIEGAGVVAGAAGASAPVPSRSRRQATPPPRPSPKPSPTVSRARIH